jgi:hypothetical protein
MDYYHRSIWSLFDSATLENLFYYSPNAHDDLTQSTNNYLYDMYPPPPRYTGQWELYENGLYLNIFEDGEQISHVSFHNHVRRNGSISHVVDDYNRRQTNIETALFDDDYYGEIDIRANNRTTFNMRIAINATQAGLQHLVDDYSVINDDVYQNGGGTKIFKIEITNIPLDNLLNNLLSVRTLLLFDIVLNRSSKNNFLDKDILTTFDDFINTKNKNKLYQLIKFSVTETITKFNKYSTLFEEELKNKIINLNPNENLNLEKFYITKTTFKENTEKSKIGDNTKLTNSQTVSNDIEKLNNKYLKYKKKYINLKKNP